MRKGFLGIISIAAWCATALVFGISTALQCLPTRGERLNPSVCLPERFPRNVEDTPMTALRLACYQGPFWEDGTGDTVTNVAALTVENTGGQMISQGAVVLEWEHRQLVFEVSAIPPGEKVLVLEKDRQALPAGFPDRCYGWTQQIYPENMGHVTAEDSGESALVITNHTTDVIPVVTICYKSRARDRNLYYWGVSYSVEVRDLQPGEKRVLTPWRYICGSSDVVQILTYTEK